MAMYSIQRRDRTADMLENGYSAMISPIITLVVGPELRLFAAYEHALLKSPYFAKRLRDQFYESSSNRLKLPDMYVDEHMYSESHDSRWLTLLQAA